MTMKEILKKLVEAETVDERMSIMEENQEILDNQSSVDANETETKILEKDNEIKTLSGELESQKQKYRDRFFGGSESEKENGNPGEDEEEKKEDVKGLDEILSNKEEVKK